ncbi:MAG: hypothetical protein U9R06_01305 [Patescibacteria group bacterium]|nr:hypothetical protein [Patescibacteria group bacterium]
MANFFIKYKKILQIASFLIFIFALGYLLYFIFFKPIIIRPDFPGSDKATSSVYGFPRSATGTGQIIKTTDDQALLPQNAKDQFSTADTIAKGGITKTTKLNNTESLGATLSSDGSQIQYYDAINKKFYKIDNKGETALLSDKTFHNVKNLTWSNAANKAIIEYPDGANIVYDFNTSKQTTLPNHWKNFDFSGDDSQIAFKSIGVDPDNRWLAVAGNDGSMAMPIEALGDKDATVYPSWSPNKQIAAMFTESIDLNRQNVYFVGLNKENFKSMVIEGRGFEYQWAPSKGRLLYSVYSNNTDLNPRLWIVSAEGENIGAGRKNLNTATWANKCVFADNIEIYCAVPEELEPGSGMFSELAENIPDNLYKINTQTGLKKLIAIPDKNYNMSNLIISDSGHYLYFTNNSDNNLYKINLK